MPIVRFLPSQKTVEVPVGTSLYAAAHKAGLPIASSCRANSVCGKCNVQIVEGKSGKTLSKKSQTETTLLEREGHPADDRISCLTRVWGDCTMTTRYW